MNGTFTYDNRIGYVEDDNAEDRDYDELLTDMQKQITAAHADREAQEYEKVELVGWATTPCYDADKKFTLSQRSKIW